MDLFRDLQFLGLGRIVFMTGINTMIKKGTRQGAGMRSLRNMAVVTALMAFLPGVVSGDYSLAKGTIAINGTMELLTGEMLRARMAKTVTSGSSVVMHAWYNDLIGTLNFDAKLSEKLRLRGGYEFRQYIKVSPPGFMGTSYNLGDFLYQEFYLREGQGIFSLMKSDPLSVELALGYMPYKYNPQSRDLGEFLFRSGTYPFFLLGEFDRPFARLTGVRATCSHKSDIIAAHADVLALTEREIRPYWDISLAAVADITLLTFFTLGGGMDLAHVIPVDSRLTTPKTNALNEPITDTRYITYNSDSTSADTGYYTFKGTKLMARATIDPVGPFRGRKGSIISELFGGEGGKIYFEGAIIGLENYPANTELSTTPMGNPYGYDKLKEKMPWMAGVTIPCWKVLDICAFEIERYPNPYPNTAALVFKSGLPLPYFGNLSETNGFALGSAYVPRWYWSLYIKKKITRSVEMALQFGRDHQRWEMPLNFLNSTYDVEDATVKPNHWGWRLKTSFKF
jgi:hypothetical protein